LTKRALYDIIIIVKEMRKMTAKELAMRIIVERITSLEDEIDKLKATLADKEDEIKRLAKYLETENEFED
jgi:uncharacterized small protein (DUF1192 family)